MAGIARTTQNIFSTTGLTPTAGFGGAANGTTTTEAGSSNTPANIQTGVAGAWAGGIASAVLGASKFLAEEDLNGALNVITSQLAYILERGIPEYDSATTYNIGDVAKGIGNTYLFSSLTNANIGNALPTPPASNTNWQYDCDLTQISVKNFTGGTTTGTANAQVLASTSPTAISLTDGYILTLTAGASNTSSLTLAITSPSISATAVKKNSGTGLVALTGGEWVTGNQIQLVYNTAGSCWVLVNGIKTANTYQASPSNPTGTTSTTGVMAGLAGSFTPKTTGAIEVIVSGAMGNSASGSDSTFAQIRYGTGSAPSNGDALSGTTVGNKASIQSSGAGVGASLGFSCNGIATGLVPGTTYWIDLAEGVVIGGTGTLTTLSMSVKEL